MKWFSSKTAKRVYLAIVVLVLLFGANIYGRNDANEVVDQAQETIALGDTNLADANNTITDLEAQLASAQATAAAVPEPTLEPTTEPTPEATPTAKPDPTINWAQVKVTSTKLNLREIKTENKAGYPIMKITDPRVQYFKGDYIWVYKTTVRADGGDFYFQVASGNGAGLYIRPDDVSLVGR